VEIKFFVKLFIDHELICTGTDIAYGRLCRFFHHITHKERGNHIWKDHNIPKGVKEAALLLMDQTHLP
jgi:hypothetical protein